MPILGAIVAAAGGVLSVAGAITCVVNPPLGIGMIAAGKATMAAGAVITVTAP
jgi:hypothetical protein